MRRVWRRSSLAGFSFEREYPLNGMLPVHLEFLRDLFIEAQLRQVDRLTALGTYLCGVLAKSKQRNVLSVAGFLSEAEPAAFADEIVPAISRTSLARERELRNCERPDVVGIG